VNASFSRMSPLQALKARLPNKIAGLAVLGVFSSVAALPAAEASTDVAAVVNSLRASPARCAGQPGLQKFVRTPELDRAAAMMASGASLQESARATGHEAVVVKGIQVTGSADQRAIETLLANGYCPFLVDPALVEMGVHQQGSTTAVVLAAAYTPAEGMSQTGIAVKILALVNEVRSQGRRCGANFFPPAAPVRWNEALARAARSHSEDMAGGNYFSHNSRDGTGPAARVERAGYNYGGTAENIAAGQMTPEAAVAAWVTSPGHCANLMSAEYTEMGVAMASNRHSAMGAYWTQVLATPLGGPSRPAKARRARV
jgi:uncharacterized protein YkwD